jgi:nicotinamide mononucleotide (NMN) deamidase PncC
MLFFTVLSQCKEPVTRAQEAVAVAVLRVSGPLGLNEPMVGGFYYGVATDNKHCSKHESNKVRRA